MYVYFADNYYGLFSNWLHVSCQVKQVESLCSKALTHQVGTT